MVNTSIILPKVNATVQAVTEHVTNTISQTAVPVFSPDQAPLWLNILIYMQMYQWELLIAILPTIYLVIVRLFGFPLLQRFNQEVVLVLYPTRVKFGKLVKEYNPYFVFKNGVYWQSTPLHNVNQYHPFTTKKGDKSGRCLFDLGEVGLCGLTKKQHKDISLNIRPNPNELHIVTHAINQEVCALERRDSKITELLNGEHKVKSIKSHNVWIMRNFFQHFHRHWEIIVDPTGTWYELRAVKNRQQFSVSLWHTLGVTLQKIEEVQKEVPIEQGGGTKNVQSLTTISVTNQIITSQLKFAKEYQNFSANQAYRTCKRMGKIESKFPFWVTGQTDWRPIIILVGAAAAIGLVLYMFHGSTPTLGPMPK